MVYYCYLCNKSSDSTPKLYMFKPNKNNLEEWNFIIGRADRNLKISHKICELHFRQEDIIRDDIFRIKGKEIRFPKLLPVLQAGAVPQKWTDSAPAAPASPKRSVSPVFTYEELMSQIGQVLLPSEAWATHKNGPVVSFVHVSYDTVTQHVVMDKVVTFTNSLTPTCSFIGVRSDLQIFCRSIDAISGILKYVDSAQLCMAPQPHKNCKGYVLDNAIICNACNEFENVPKKIPIKKRKRKY